MSAEIFLTLLARHSSPPQRLSSVWLPVKKTKDQSPHHQISAHSLMTDWHELMQIYKEAEEGKRTCLYEWQVATDRAADRKGRDLDLTVLALEISFPLFPFLPHFFSVCAWHANPFPPATEDIWQHTAVSLDPEEPKGGGRVALISGPGLRWVTFVTQGCAVVISLSVGTRLSWLFLLRKMDRLTQELTASR